jgi:putative SOS response-associated peptidase YedK
MEQIYSCTMITTDAVEDFQKIHNRQPVMLTFDALERWLDPEVDGHELIALLLPHLPTDMLITEVDPKINNSHIKEPSRVLDNVIRLSSPQAGITR